MNKKKYLGLFVMTHFFALPLFAQTLEWVKQVGGDGKDEAYSVAVDAAGNVYTTGSFTRTVDFDPGEGIFNFTVTHQGEDMFIQKLDASGNFVWARQMVNGGSTSEYGGVSYSQGLAISVDASEGIYVTGDFRATVDFDPGPETANLTAISAGDDDAFILKLNSEGSFEWVKQIGATKDVQANSITVDGEGNVYTTGDFRGEADFDPGVDIYFLFAESYTAYIQKLDPAGNLIWAKEFAEASTGSSIAVDTEENVFVTGFFVGGPSMGEADIFVIKHDKHGEMVWLELMGGVGDDYGRALTLDADGNIFLSGIFEQTADFNIGGPAVNLTSLGKTDVFMAKMKNTGEVIWLKQMGGPGYEEVRSISLDPEGNIYTTGAFSGMVDFDPGNPTFNITSEFNNGTFVQNLDSAGEFAWAMQLPGSTYSIRTDNPESILLTGYFLMTGDFDPGPGTVKLDGNESLEIFILKLNPNTILGISKEDWESGFTIYPNPSHGQVQLNFPESIESVMVHITGMDGKLIREQIILNGPHSMINMDGLAKGMYLITLFNKDKVKTFKQLIINPYQVE